MNLFMTNSLVHNFLLVNRYYGKAALFVKCEHSIQGLLLMIRGFSQPKPRGNIREIELFSHYYLSEMEQTSARSCLDSLSLAAETAYFGVPHSI